MFSKNYFFGPHNRAQTFFSCTGPAAQTSPELFFHVINMSQDASVVFPPRISNVKKRVLAIKVENGKWVQWDQNIGKLKTVTKVTKANIAMKKIMVVTVKVFPALSLQNLVLSRLFFIMLELSLYSCNKITKT